MVHLRHGGSFDMRVEGGGNSGGYIFGMCNGYSSVASYCDPKTNLSLFGGLESMIPSFLFEYTN